LPIVVDACRSFSRRSFSSGFTLLEVCVALFIVSVLFVVAVPPAAHLLQEEQLQRPVRELQSLAKSARRLAMTEQRSFQLLLLDDGYQLRPVVEKKGEKWEPVSYRLPGEIRFAIRRPGERDFARSTDGRWIFQPNGLCEPLTFRFERAGDYLQFTVNPLTATIENQESVVR
jgi:prepilin-type N-terminal cleavage/methylation domain-containing protein